MSKEIYHMKAAVRNFKKRRAEKVSSWGEYSSMGRMGTVYVEIWTSKRGGYLKMEECDSGCTLTVLDQLPHNVKQHLTST